MLKICKDKSAANFLVKFVYETQHMHDQRKSITKRHPSVLFVAQGKKNVSFIIILNGDQLFWNTTLKYLGAKWLPKKKVNFMPCMGALVSSFSEVFLM